MPAKKVFLTSLKDISAAILTMDICFLPSLIYDIIIVIILVFYHVQLFPSQAFF